MLLHRTSCHHSLSSRSQVQAYLKARNLDYLKHKPSPCPATITTLLAAGTETTMTILMEAPTVEATTMTPTEAPTMIHMETTPAETTSQAGTIATRTGK